jgi:hypothetical protein
MPERLDQQIPGSYTVYTTVALTDQELTVLLQVLDLQQ